MKRFISRNTRECVYRYAVFAERCAIAILRCRAGFPSLPPFPPDSGHLRTATKWSRDVLQIIRQARVEVHLARHLRFPRQYFRFYQVELPLPGNVALYVALRSKDSEP